MDEEDILDSEKGFRLNSIIANKENRMSHQTNKIEYRD